MLHDPGGTFGAQNTLVHRMIAVSFDVSYCAVLEMYFYSTSTRTCSMCIFDFVGNVR